MRNVATRAELDCKRLNSNTLLWKDITEQFGDTNHSEYDGLLSNKWTIEQLRKECTAREIRVPRTHTSLQRVELLQQYDRIKLGVEIGVIGEGNRKTNHCVFRLLNVIFFYAFCDQFSEMGNIATRVELDRKYSNSNTLLWKDITEQFLNTNSSEYDGLLSNNVRFEGIDPSKVAQHDSAKLYDMWKNTNTKYVEALAKFT